MHPIGGGTIPQSVISPEDIEQLEKEVDALTVKNTPSAPLTPFVPAHLAYDKKVLKFTGYFQETLPTGIEENCPNYRYRFVEIFYYLEVKMFLLLKLKRFRTTQSHSSNRLLKTRVRPRANCCNVNASLRTILATVTTGLI